MKSPTKANNNVKFLTQSAAQKMPFSSKNFSDVLIHFSFSENSMEVDSVKDTIVLVRHLPYTGNKSNAAERSSSSSMNPLPDWVKNQPSCQQTR
ncbi:hypothetical protein PTKIN_Ptkin11bG0173600 [Pterospermum kingtungense]